MSGFLGAIWSTVSGVVKAGAAAVAGAFTNSLLRDKSKERDKERESKAALVRQENAAKLADRQFQQKQEELNLEQKKYSLAVDKCKADWAIAERSAAQEEQNYRQRQQALAVQLQQAKTEAERVEIEKSRLALDKAWIAAQAEIEKTKIALQEQDLALKKQDVALKKQEFEARQAYQAEYLLALRDYHQARIQTELQAAQTAFDAIKSPFCLSRSDIEAIFNQQTESARLVVLVAQPGVNQTVPASLRENVTQEIQNSLLSFVQTNFPLGSVAPVKFYGQFFDRSIFNTQTEVLKRLLGDIPVVAIYSDITDHQFFLNYELWGSGGEPISGQFVTLDYLDLIEQMEQEGLSEQKILIQVRKTIVKFHQLCLAFLTDLHYLGLNPLYEPQLCYALVREEFPEELLEPIVQQLRDLQIKQVEEYQRQVWLESMRG